MPFRKFAPPPLTPPFLPSPRMASMPGIYNSPPSPDLPMPVEDIGGARVPPPLDRPKNAALDQFDAIQSRRPAPLKGVSRLAAGFAQGGVPGIIGAALDRQGPQREQYQADMEALKGRNDLQRQQEQDETNKAYRQSLTEDAEARRDQRMQSGRDQELGREAALTQQFGSEMPNGALMDGDPEFEVNTIDGKTRRKRSAYGQAIDKQKAEQTNWLEVPAELVQAFPQSLKAGQKIAPAQLEHYQRMYEAKQKESAPTSATLAVKAAQGDPQAKKALELMRERPPSVTMQMRGSDSSFEDETADSLAKGDLTRLRDIASLRGDQRMRIFAKAKRINPQFNTADIDRKIKMEDYYANGKGADSLRSFDIFLQHASNAADAFNEVQNTRAAIVNRPMNWIRANMGDAPEYRRLVTALEPAAKEYMTFLLNNHALHESDRTALQAIIDGNMSPKAAVTTLREMAHVAEARIGAEGQRYRRTMGRDLADDVLSEEAKQAASKLGVNLRGGGPAPLGAPAPQGGSSPMEQFSPSTGQYRHSLDGGKTWQPGRATKR